MAALQLVTVRYLGCFLTDPLAVPTEVLDVVAGQLEIADPPCVKRYTEREKTRLDHMWEIQQAFAPGAGPGPWPRLRFDALTCR